MAAAAALILMAAQGSGSAYLDGVHGPKMIAGQPMGLSIRRAMLTEDFRHLQATRCSHPGSGLRNLWDGFIERRGDLGGMEA